MLDHGDMFLRPAVLPNFSVISSHAFQSYFTNWIFYFDTLLITIVGRDSNIASKYMHKNLSTPQSKLCNIATEAPWSFYFDARSHQFLHKVIDRLSHQSEHDCRPDLSNLLSNSFMAWNTTFCPNNILPHYHRFRTMTQILGSTHNPSWLHERQQLMTDYSNRKDRPMSCKWTHTLCYDPV